MKRLLVCDHRDSFSSNLVAALSNSTTQLFVVDSASLLTQPKRLEDLILRSDALILSPGPGNPAHYPASLQLAQHWPTTKPLLGVCLGLQIMLYAAGCHIRRITKNPIHGRQEHLTQLYPSRLLPREAIPDLCVFYNSLGCEVEDEALQRSSWNIVASSAGDIVALAEHRQAPHILTQFHPESFATKRGTMLIDAFLGLIRE
jgi:anthranilate/para-aminobenzoate synthase component II